MNKACKALAALLVTFLATDVGIVSAQQKKKNSDDRYAEVKKQLPEDLYPVYRMLERIIQTNKINESIGITVRSTTPEECVAMTGNKEICQIVGDMPDVKAKDSMFAWAIQVVASTNSLPNASADGSSGLIRMQKSMTNGLSDKPAALACVVGHEVAHLTEKHSKKIAVKGSELDSVASEKISSAINNAKSAQRSQQAWAAFAMGLNAAAGTYQGALSNLQLANSMQNDAAQGAAEFQRFMQLNYATLKANAPKSLGALEDIGGLGANLIKRTRQDTDEYLNEYRRELMSFSRQQELEADAKGVEFVAKAGIDPSACLEVVELIHRTTGEKTTSSESSHPGEDERKTKMQQAINALQPSIRNRYKALQVKQPILPYLYDENSQVVKIMPLGTPGMKSGKNSKSASVDALLGN
jgi:hypothetical protein